MVHVLSMVTTGNGSNPTIAVYRGDQVYPRFVIKYRRRLAPISSTNSINTKTTELTNKISPELFWARLGVHTQNGQQRFRFQISKTLPVNLVKFSFLPFIITKPDFVPPHDYPLLNRRGKNKTELIVTGVVKISVQLRSITSVTSELQRFYVVDELEYDAYVTQESANHLEELQRNSQMNNF